MSRSWRPTFWTVLLATTIVAVAIAAGLSAGRSRVAGKEATNDPGAARVHRLRTVAAQPGIWISLDEIRKLPTKGASFKNVKAAADGALGPAQIADQNSNHDVNTLAVALMYGRTGSPAYKSKAVDAIMSAIGTEQGGTSLALDRNLPSYVIAADIVGMDGPDGDRFKSWLRQTPTEVMADGNTMIDESERRPNNQGTHAGAARAAVAAYFGDSAELDRVARIFKGWLGDTASWSDFRFGEDWWQCDPGRPVGINPKGCTRDGHSLDGVLPDDQRRSGSFTWPPPKENYVYEALQGALVQAEILSRAGYPAWSWQTKALLRAFRWLYDQAGYQARGDDEWQPWLINKRYGVKLPAGRAPRTGKNMGWTDWTHGTK